MNLDDIIEAIIAGDYRFTDHGKAEAINDGLTEAEIAFSVNQGEILEDYPNDRPFPSCLIFGLSPSGEPVHSVWAYDELDRRAAMITVYRPDSSRWIDFRIRR